MLSMNNQMLTQETSIRYLGDYIDYLACAMLKLSLFFNYCIIAWGNTYQTTLQPLFILQKKALRITTFSSYNEHSSPFFYMLGTNKIVFVVVVVELSEVRCKASGQSKQ